MKNFIRFLCAAMLLVSFEACDEKDNQNDNPGDGDNTTLATQLVGNWQSEHILINGEEAHMQMTLEMNADGTGKITELNEPFSWQVSGNDVTIINSQGNILVFTVTNITEEILVITGNTIPGTGQQAQFEGHFKKVGGGTPGDPDPGDLGISAPELVESTTTSLTLSAHITGNVSEYLVQFPNYTCGVIYECDQELSMNHNVVTATPNSDGSFTLTLSGLELGKDYMVAAWLRLTPESEAIISNTRVYATNNPNPPNASDWIDLGLPSGLLWASCNVGATTPNGYGNYYAWAETATKDYYDWNTYTYCINGNYHQLTKYCSHAEYGYNGYTDNLTILQATDDAATTVLGNGARTPTKEEWEELVNNTTSTWTTYNGVSGRLFIAANGNTLFLPAAGFRRQTGVGDDGFLGSYWSSSLFTGDTPYNAWYYYSGNETLEQDMFGCPRREGYPIRAVRAPQK